MDHEFTRRLLGWYRAGHRDLPWRATRDPYAIWISEVMLQQTRASVVAGYYTRFLERFPAVHALAAAPEQDLLHAWSGLGYYRRARQLQEAARRIVERSAFPATYESLRGLPGIGEYTAAAIASIAFGQPHAAVDGNVLRVLSRLDNNPADILSTAGKAALTRRANELLDANDPGAFNQAMMELGATVCLPRQPLCLLCPAASLCRARAAGTAGQLPVKLARATRRREERLVFIVQRGGALLLRQRPADAQRLAGLWELPESADLPRVPPGRELGRFKHAITVTDFEYAVHAAAVRGTPNGFEWIPLDRLPSIPLTTVSRKALQLLEEDLG